MGGAVRPSAASSGPNLQAMILDVMRELKKQYNSNFVNKNDVWTSCQNKMTTAQFNSFVENLENEGSIYQAGNNDTFCLTDD